MLRLGAHKRRRPDELREHSREVEIAFSSPSLRCSYPSHDLAPKRLGARSWNGPDCNITAAARLCHRDGRAPEAATPSPSSVSPHSMGPPSPPPSSWRHVLTSVRLTIGQEKNSLTTVRIEKDPRVCRPGNRPIRARLRPTLQGLQRLSLSPERMGRCGSPGMQRRKHTHRSSRCSTA